MTRPFKLAPGSLPDDVPSHFPTICTVRGNALVTRGDVAINKALFAAGAMTAICTQYWSGDNESRN